MKIPIPNIRIRKATAKDAEQICKLYHETVMALDRTAYTQAQIQKWDSLCAENASWQQKIDKDHYLLAIDDNCKTYGFCSLQDNGCIDTLYVQPAYQQMGVAQSLLHAVYELADEMRIPALFANVSLDATLFYEQNGFIVRETSAREIEGVHFTSVLVDKRLWLM